MAIIKFDKEKLFDFIREIITKNPRLQSHYSLENQFKYRDKDGKMSCWLHGGWSVPTDALDADEIMIKEVRTENKYEYYLMFTEIAVGEEQVIRYNLDDRYLEAIGIERKEKRRM